MALESPVYVPVSCQSADISCSWPKSQLFPHVSTSGRSIHDQSSVQGNNQLKPGISWILTTLSQLRGHTPSTFEHCGATESRGVKGHSVAAMFPLQPDITKTTATRNKRTQTSCVYSRQCRSAAGRRREEEQKTCV